MTRTTSVLPTPAVAGWTEDKRIREARSIRLHYEDHGGIVVQERRIRNLTFDGPGERTTFEFVVDWDPSKKFAP